MPELITVVRLIVLVGMIGLLCISAIVWLFTENVSEQKLVAGVWVVIIFLNLWLVFMAAKTGSVI